MLSILFNISFYHQDFDRHIDNLRSQLQFLNGALEGTDHNAPDWVATDLVSLRNKSGRLQDDMKRFRDQLESEGLAEKKACGTQFNGTCASVLTNTDQDNEQTTQHRSEESCSTKQNIAYTEPPETSSHFSSRPKPDSTRRSFAGPRPLRCPAYRCHRRSQPALTRKSFTASDGDSKHIAEEEVQCV